MIIKPIETESEFIAYGRARYYCNANHHVTGSINKNISKIRNEFEFDAYDLNSFHFGAFDKGNLYACSRMVNDTKRVHSFQLSDESKTHIGSLSEPQQPEHGIALQDYVAEKEYDKVESFFNSIRSEGKKFNEIGRLIRCIKQGDKYLINYMVCYVLAFFRLHNIDYCFFDAAKSHCDYYKRFFNASRVLQDVEFRPVTGGKPFFLMQLMLKDLSDKMDNIVCRILKKFKENTGSYTLRLEEIK